MDHEVLYARAALPIARIYGLLGQNNKMLEYEKRYKIIKNAINEILWDDEAGYYINFKKYRLRQRNRES